MLTLDAVTACLLDQLFYTLEVSISQKLWESLIVGRLHEVDAFVGDSLQGTNIHHMAYSVVRLIGHFEGVLEVALEALARSFFDVSDEVGLAVDGGERDDQAGIIAHFILHIYVTEGNSNADTLVSHRLFEPDREILFLGRALEMVVASWPLIEVGVCGRGNRRLRVRVFGGEFFFVVVFKQSFLLCFVGVVGLLWLMAFGGCMMGLLEGRLMMTGLGRNALENWRLFFPLLGAYFFFPAGLRSLLL